MEIVLLIVGIIIGALAGYLVLKNKSNQPHEQVDLEKYVSKEIFVVEKQKSAKLETQSIGKDKEIQSLIGKNSSLKTEIEIVKSNIEEEKEQLKVQFENLANKILETNSKKITEQNKTNIDQILKPLNEKITSFEKTVHDKYEKEIEGRVSLEEQIKHLTNLNQQISKDADNLTKALKGDSKTQGDWGELQLEGLLENAGLEKNVHFSTQISIKDDGGNNKRPDCVINLPDSKHLIIDSKVSLTAYEEFYSSNDDEDRKIFLKKHLESIKNHIRDLSSKDYTKLYGINSPDYVLMYIPIEPALTLALQEEQAIFKFGLERDIILVSTSTLLATLRTVSFIWQQENQKKNVLEIAKQSGLLYDKFVGFVEDLQDIDKHLEKTKKSYDGAMSKLKDGSGNLVGKVEAIKKLGAKAKKNIPSELLPELDE